jgi:hemoglobin-like flavoprotein
MDARTIELLAMSFARISANKHDAATLFYARLFTTAPQLRPMFQADLEQQKQKLMVSLAQIIDFYRVGGDAERYLTRLGRGHSGYGVQRSHFDAVGDALIFTLAQILADDFTPEIRSAWINAYAEVSEHMMQALESVPASVPPPLAATARW